MTDTNTSYDLVVIGAGPGGYVGAFRAAQLGLKVAIIEKRERLGGTCLNVGCIPSKALLDSSEHFFYAKNKLDKHGIFVSDVRLDLEKMMKRKESVVDSLTRGLDSLVKRNKVDRYEGFGKVLKSQGGIHQVEVLLTKGGDKKTLATKNILLATGSEATELPHIPFDRKRILSSTEALSLSEVPSHLVVVGGGFIGLEMGSVWARLGAKVTVLEFMDKLLPMCDSQCVRDLQKALTKQGLEIRLSTKCLSAKVNSGSKTTITVEVEEKDKGQSKLECDYVLVSTGRRPFTDGLGLEDIGVKKDAKGRVLIDSHFKTNVSGIYAIGDIVEGPMLAHKAEDEGVAAAEIMAGKKGHVNYGVIPNVIYTWPELASVGKTEEELKTAGVAFKTGVVPFMANARAKAMEETEGLVKVIADATTDKVLGVHIVGPWASDLIGEAASVMEFGGSSEDIARTCHAHPTLSETVREAALAVEKRTLNF
jgi:dihydrolipoamide dehydrogenase